VDDLVGDAPVELAVRKPVPRDVIGCRVKTGLTERSGRASDGGCAVGMIAP